MKLTNFNELWGAVNGFGNLIISKTPLFIHAGLDTNLEDVFAFDDGLFTVLDDGTVRKTIIYISERKSWYDDRGYDYPKYHIFNCQTVETMRKNQKKDRYKKTAREDDLFFMIKSFKDGNSERFYKRLDVCAYCLNTFNKKYSKSYVKTNFKTKYYIDQKLFNPFELNNYNDDFTTAPSYYSKHWSAISNSLKKQKNYICECCSVNLENNKKFLHTHHLDSNPSNNVLSNLKVLCIECHSQEYNHGHIKSSKDYKEFIYLKNQGEI